MAIQYGLSTLFALQTHPQLFDDNSGYTKASQSSVVRILSVHTRALMSRFCYKSCYCTSIAYCHSNPLNAELNPIWDLPALAGAHHDLHVSRKRVKRLRWSRGSVLAFGTQVRGFKPSRSRRIFQG